MSDKEYIERGALIAMCKRQIECEWNTLASPGTWAHAFEDFSDLVEQTPAADVVSKGVYDQVKWERDMAMQQLEEHGIPFGGEADDVVNVVRCKDCKYFKHFKGCGNWCHRRIRTDIEFHTKTNDFCSWGKRKDKDDGR